MDGIIRQNSHAAEHTRGCNITSLVEVVLTINGMETDKNCNKNPTRRIFLSSLPAIAKFDGVLLKQFVVSLGFKPLILKKGETTVKLNLCSTPNKILI